MHLILICFNPFPCFNSHSKLNTPSATARVKGRSSRVCNPRGRRWTAGHNRNRGISLDAGVRCLHGDCFFNTLTPRASIACVQIGTRATGRFPARKDTGGLATTDDPPSAPIWWPNLHCGVRRRGFFAQECVMIYIPLFLSPSTKKHMLPTYQPCAMPCCKAVHRRGMCVCVCAIRAAARLDGFTGVARSILCNAKDVHHFVSDQHLRRCCPRMQVAGKLCDPLYRWC